jgi:5-methylcytosine-specific restriction enzyme subunit McrC
LALTGDRAALDRPTQHRRPDITWWSRRKCIAVVDAKYKALRLGEMPNADVYQMLAYCTAFGLPHGHLVYAASQERPASHRIARTPITIAAHTVDLDVAIPELLTAVDVIADGLAAQMDPRSANSTEWPQRPAASELEAG